jgi:hypothetical protein
MPMALIKGDLDFKILELRAPIDVIKGTWT